MARTWSALSEPTTVGAGAVFRSRPFMEFRRWLAYGRDGGGREPPRKGASELGPLYRRRRARIPSSSESTTSAVMARDALSYAGLTLLLAWSLVAHIASAMPVGGDNQ